MLHFLNFFFQVLHDKAEWQYSEREKESLEVFYTRTSRGNRISCMFVRCRYVKKPDLVPVFKKTGFSSGFETVYKWLYC